MIKHRKSIHVRHHQVEDDEIGPFSSSFLQRRWAVAHFAHFEVPLCLEDAADEPPGILVVIDDEDVLHPTLVHLQRGKQTFLRPFRE